MDMEIQAIDAMVNGIALRAVLEPESWPSERQVNQLEHYEHHPQLVLCQFSNDG